jgi:hypothetical protein
VPTRRRPAPDGESATEVCSGIAISASRLRSLVTTADELADLPVSGTQLRAPADSLVGMRTAWRQVDSMWDELITKKKLLPTPAMTDASDLVLRSWIDDQRRRCFCGGSTLS